MQFFKAQLILSADPTEGQDRMGIRRITRRIAGKTEEFNLKLKEDGFFCVKNFDDDEVNIIALVVKEGIFNKQLKSFIRCLGFNFMEMSVDEITFSNFATLLMAASHEGCIANDDEILEKFGLDRLSGRWGSAVDYGENFIEDSSKEALVDMCHKFLATETILPEIERMYQSKNKVKISGHPVHYILQSDDRDIRKELYRGLLSGLFECGRLKNRRYTYVDFRSSSEFSRAAYDALYNSNCGGAVVVRFTPSAAVAEEDGEYDNSDREILQTIGSKALKYKNKVLTIICLPRSCNSIKSMLYEYLGDISCIEMQEDMAQGELAADFLKRLAKEDSIRTDKKLFAQLEEGKKYLSSELRQIYSSWFDQKLKTSVYPQYKLAKSAKKEVLNSTTKSNAYEKLNSMIGLETVKKQLDDIINYHKAQKVFESMGLQKNFTNLHCVFTGNPGTGKSVTARVFSEALRQAGVLSKGTFVQADRSALIAKYVGQTAPLVHKVFQSAKGGVLFIDECYSLFSDDPFSKEALAQICLELEENREDLVCIFAGYGNEVNEMIDANPGLRSRIGYYLNYPDYDVEDLCKISVYIADEKGAKISGEAMDKLKEIYEEAVKQPDFGNARGVRSIIEHAIIQKANRLLKMDIDKVSKEDVITIKPEDIETPQFVNKVEEKFIGFCA